MTPCAAISFFGDLLQTISDRGRDLVGLGRGDLAARAGAAIDGTPSAEILATGQPGTAVWAFVAWMVALTVVLLAAAAAFRRPTMS